MGGGILQSRPASKPGIIITTEIHRFDGFSRNVSFSEIIV
jgi:hypothetical protein